jgi:hypoxia up-regulated 1
MVLKPFTSICFSVVLLLVTFCVTDAALAAMSIDVGSQFLKIGLVKPGIPMETVLNKESQRKTANLIAFHNGERYFGELALQMSYKHPERVIPYVSDLVGKQYNNPIVQDYIKQYPYLNITEDPVRGTVIINTKDSGSFDIETLVAMILWNAHEQAVVYGKTPIHDVVITVPSYLNQAERQCIVRATEIAGLTLLQLMSDNSAAALNYAFTRRKEITEKAQNVLIFDIGASKTTATVVELKLAKSNASKTLEPVVAVKGIGYNRRLGGKILTYKLRDLLAEEFTKKHKTSKAITENLRSMSKLLKEAERVKHILSANSETYAQVESLFEDIDFKHKVNRDFISNLLQEYESEYMKPVSDALKMAELNVDNIDQVILFGAGTRIPRIQDVLKEFFKGKEPNRFLNTDESAALGALYQAAHLSKGFKVKMIEVQELVTYPIQINFETAGVGESNELRRVDRTVFSYKSSWPTNRKIMTFTSHSSDFVVNLHYSSLDYLTKTQLEEFGDFNITDVSFNGIVEAIKKNLDDNHVYKGVKAYFQIDNFGLVKSDGAEVIIEPIKKNSTVDSIVESIGKFFGAGGDKEETKEGLKDEAPTPPPSTEEAKTQSESEEAPEDPKEPESKEEEPKEQQEPEKVFNETATNDTVKNRNETVTNGTASSKPKKEQKPKVIKAKLKVKLYKSFVDLNKENIKESKKILSTFEKVEKLKAERDAAHNGIEARVYELKERLTNVDFTKFAQGNEIENLTKILEETATWIEDEANLSTTTEEFKNKRAPIEEIVSAIEKRIRDLIEAELRKKAEAEAKKKAEELAKKKAAEEAKKKEEEALKAAAKEAEGGQEKPEGTEGEEKVEGNEDTKEAAGNEEENEKATLNEEEMPSVEDILLPKTDDKAHVDL